MGFVEKIWIMFIGEASWMTNRVCFFLVNTMYVFNFMYAFNFMFIIVTYNIYKVLRLPSVGRIGGATSYKIKDDGG